MVADVLQSWHETSPELTMPGPLAPDQKAKLLYRLPSATRPKGASSLLAPKSLGLLKTKTSSTRFQAVPPVVRREAAHAVLVASRATNVLALARPAAVASARQKASAFVMLPDGDHPAAVTNTWRPGSGAGLMSPVRSVRKQYSRKADEQPFGLSWL